MVFLSVYIFRPDMYVTFAAIFDNYLSNAENILNANLTYEVSSGNNFGQREFGICGDQTAFILSTGNQWQNYCKQI